MEFHETVQDVAALPQHHQATHDEKLVITASSLGTVFEWYDFYLYGLLATFISKVFFAGVNETTGFILALGAFAAGFAVRPFGALVFGRGEAFYNFRGLHQYKDKFSPEWEARYLALPNGIMVLPRVLADLTALIAGGFKGAIGK